MVLIYNKQDVADFAYIEYISLLLQLFEIITQILTGKRKSTTFVSTFLLGAFAGYKIATIFFETLYLLV